ncbi:hypothetical protein NQ314_015644 [Rhamnusium bicolor]|uniref:Uncharacterized protein n=1 Tax=Rhamnusium bicolor TaxID=1586634 RepID=A0AAV8WYG0_9CUCU|nr:hypothetical protein NQ314_015644 [Rhamnusium bicolor]
MGDALDFCDKIGDNLSELGKWRVWQNIILGQFLSLILCALNTLSHYINSSTTSVLPTGGWRYLLLCLIDVQANTLLSTAHQFTTLTSIQVGACFQLNKLTEFYFDGFQLLGCVAIPVALALSCLVLGVRYRMVHIIAVSVCLMGVGCLVWANIEDTKIDAVSLFLLFSRSECQLPEHMNTDSPERTNNEILSAFGTLNSNDTFPLSHSTNTTFTSFYGSHDVLNNQTTSA